MGETTRLTFRKMTTDDAVAVAELDAKSFSEQDSWDSDCFLDELQIPDSVYIVGEVDGKIIACAGVEFSQGAAEIKTFAVDTEFRRCGVGKKLLSEIFALSKSHGATMIFLEVRPSNRAAFKFYAKFGFQIVDRIKNFYDDEDAWIMMTETS